MGAKPITGNIEATRSFSTIALKVAAVFLVYATVSVISTWPLFTHLGTHITDHFGDGALHLWNSWWVGQALAEGRSPFFTDRIFYPNGVSLITQNFAWFHILPSLLLSSFLNDIAAFNVAVLINLTLCGVALFWVAYKLTGSVQAAFIAGLIYQMWPYRLARLDLPNMLATYWIPLFLLFLILALENGQRRYAVLAGLCLALAGYTRWQLLLPAGIMGLIILIFYLPWRAPTPQQSALLTNLILSGVVAGLLLLAPALLLLQDEASVSDLTHSSEEVIMSADLLAFATPSQLHAVLSESTEPLHDRYYFDREGLRRRPSYIGLVPLLLAIGGIYYYRRHAWPWVVIFLVLLFFALGPILRVNGVLYDNIPTLYGLLSPLGVLQLMRNPERFVMFLALPMAVLAAYGMAGLLKNHATLHRYGWLLTALVGVLIFFEYYSPQAVLRDRADPPAFYSDLASEEGTFAILNLPFDNLKARAYMGDQMVHSKAIVQGNLSRVPESADRYVDESPWLSTLDWSGEMAPGFPDISRQLGMLSADGIRYMIMHKDKVGSDRIAHWQRALILRPLYEDESLIVYTTEPRAGRDFDLPPGWEPGPAPAAVDLSAACLHPGHVLVASIGWGTNKALENNLDAQVALIDGGGESRVSGRFSLVDGWPSEEWPSGTLAWGHYRLDLPPSLPPGDYDLELTLLDSASGETKAGPQIIEQMTVQESICNLATVQEATDANVIFDDQLRLVEWTAAHENDKLKLDLYWRAERFIDDEYTIFVHVFDRETAVPVAQDDGRPRDGAYPMRFWQPGEVVDDRVTVSLSGVASGEYGIAIGVYDPVTGARLPILAQHDEPLFEDGRFVLAQTVVVP